MPAPSEIFSPKARPSASCRWNPWRGGKALEQTHNHGAFFFVLAEQAQWRDISIPDAVKSYVDLQNFVKAQAGAAGIDTGRPFPFRLSGTPADRREAIESTYTPLDFVVPV